MNHCDYLNLKDLFTIILGVGTLILSGILVFIANRQLKINRNQLDVNKNQSEINKNQLEINKNQLDVNSDKLRLDLFEKRFLIYSEFKKLFFDINQNEGVDAFYIQRIDPVIKTSVFLFDKDILDYHQEIVENNFKILELRNTIPHSDEDIKQLTSLKSWFSKEHQNLENRFSKYLDFKNIFR